MNIYIPDIKLPKDEPGAFQVIVMYVGADGKLRAECEGTHEVTIVPPHGRLIDADALMKDGWVLHKQVMRMGGYAIHELPLTNPSIAVIIPASGGQEDE